MSKDRRVQEILDEIDHNEFIAVAFADRPAFKQSVRQKYHEFWNEDAEHEGGGEGG